MRGNEHNSVCDYPIAYVLLWFPLSSETFIFREVLDLEKLDLDIRVYTLYGKSFKGCSKNMRNYPGPVTRMGIRSFFSICSAFFRSLIRKPSLTITLMKRGLFRRMRNFEALCENTWCFFAGFLLAEKCLSDNIRLIHSAWGNGPATAAWIASQVSGIPFAFTGRAGDIYPQDGILPEKSADALFIRTNNLANVSWLTSFCPQDSRDKVILIYNGLTFRENASGPRKLPQAPFHILAVGRFARTKGFPELLTAMARLRRENFPIELTLVGDGAWRGKLLALRHRLALDDCVHMPGFVPNDKLSNFMMNHDLLVVPSVIHSNGDRDGIPNVIMEALSLGMPVVATDVCGISEVIKDGETGFLVPQRNPAALSIAIRNMLESPERALAMGNAGKNLVKSIFDSTRNAQSLKNLYLSSIQECGYG